MSITDRLRHSKSSSDHSESSSEADHVGGGAHAREVQPSHEVDSSRETHQTGSSAAAPAGSTVSATSATSADRHEDAYERFGGANWGAAFFGWLVAVAITVLLSSIIAAVATAVESTTTLTMDDAQREAGAIGLGTAIAVVAVMLIAYYTGGYVAGRMSRFDGGRQGLVVWVIGLAVTLLAVAVGAVLGDQYNVMDRVDLPRLPIPTDTATWGGIITALAILVGTLLAAMAGGKVGHRYHNRVDRVAYR